MPRQTKQQLELALATEKASVREFAKENEFLMKRLDAKDQRIKDIAAENESLRTDKKWLQQMHSGLLQSIPELLLRTRNALSR